MDDNVLRRLLSQLSPEDMDAMGPNALAQAMQPQQAMPQPRYDIAPMQMNTMRAENGPDAGKVTNLNFQPQAQGQPQGQPQQQRQMRVVGAGGGSTVELSPEAAGPVALDMTRAPIDVPGVGKAYYSKDGRGAYVMGPDGQPSTKVILGYDDAASRARTKANIDQQKTLADITQTQAQTAHTNEQIRASQANTPDNGPGTAVGDAMRSGVTGDAFLQTLDPAKAALVKQITSGKMAPPTGMAMRNPQVLNLMEMAAMAEPGFDAATWAQRYKTAQDFSSGGKSGQAITAFSTLLDHVNNVAKTGAALNNFGGFPFSNDVNDVVNNVEGRSGDPRISAFQAAKVNFDNELAKAMASGHITDSSVAKQAGTLSMGQSDAQRQASLQQIVSMLGSKINETGNAYIRGMGAKGVNPADLLTPGAKETYLKYMGADSPSGTMMNQPTVAQLTNPAERAKAVFDAKKAIQQGADPGKVRQRLQQAGINDAGI